MLFKHQLHLFAHQRINMKLEQEIKQEAFVSAQQKAVVNLIFSYSWLKAQISSGLKPFGITMQQYNVLRILKGQHPKGITTADIRGRMLDKMSDASRLVNRLENMGLVVKKVDFNDRRLVSVKISDQGLKLLEAIRNQNQDLEHLMQNLTTDELVQLNELLDKLRG